MPEKDAMETEAVMAKIDKTAEINADSGKPEIPVYAFWLVFALILFPPTGLISLWYAFKSGDFAGEGDYKSAFRASDNIRRISKISVILGLLWMVGFVLYKKYMVAG